MHDVNADGNVSALDSLYVINAISVGTAAIDLPAADLNRDQMIDHLDAKIAIDAIVARQGVANQLELKRSDHSSMASASFNPIKPEDADSFLDSLRGADDGFGGTDDGPLDPSSVNSQNL